jgi:nicotinamidase-related amidase
MAQEELPIPKHFDPDRVGEVWKVDYLQREPEAEAWAGTHRIPPAHEDHPRICLLAVDVQNTFCTPGFELFVAGRSGNAAVEDNRRLCAFLYRNLHRITRIAPTMDTHTAMQIFHRLFLVDDQGEHPDPLTTVTVEDVREGRWRANPAVCPGLGVDEQYAREHLLSYVEKLARDEKYDLTVWPYHAMLGGIGHALVSALEEAVFFHTVCRKAQPDFQVKGSNPLTEHYSVLGPEVREDPEGKPIARKNQELVEKLEQYDAVVIAGQAKSHCVAWTIDDLLEDLSQDDPRLARKVYLLEDCTSPVVVPGVADFTEAADAAFDRFADAGMHVVRSTDPMDAWPDFPGA